jgi:iron complex outermembrane receptor protein
MTIQLVARVVALMSAACFSATAVAQELEEIVVTAQKRNQSIQDVPISISALTADDIQRRGFTSTDDIQFAVPGLVMSRPGGDSLDSLPAIRGVSQNDFSSHQEMSTAAYIDGAYVGLTRVLTTDLFDMDRIEVLRGPQGTLFGRNATGGLIQYISKQPTDQFDADVDTTVGSFDQRRFEAAVGGPLAESWQGRIAGVIDDADGITQNLIGRDEGSTKYRAVRAQLRYDSSPVDVLAEFNYGRDPSPTAGNYHHQSAYPNSEGLGVNLPPNQNYWGTCNGCDILGYAGPTNVHEGEYDPVGYLDRTTWSQEITATVHDGDHLTFTSVSEYLGHNHGYLQNASASPEPLLNYYEWQTAHQFSQELRANGDFSGARWVAGVYFLSLDTANKTLTDSPVFDGTPYAYGVLADFNTTTQNYSAFAQSDFDLTQQLYLTVGGRWSRDKKTMDFNLYNEITGGNNVFAYYGDRTFDGESGKLQLNYHPDEHLLLYGGVTRGTKAGGFNAPYGGAISPSQMPFNSEVLTDYEVGLKITTRQLRWNVNVFHYNYQNYQAFDLLNLVDIVSNKPARMDGMDTDLTMSPAKGLELIVGASYLDATVKDVVLPYGEVVDTRPPQAPRYSFDTLVRKTWSVAGYDLAAQADYRYLARFYSSISNAPDTLVPGAGVVGVRFSVGPSDDRWEVALLAKNLLNKDVMTVSYDLSGFGITEQVYAPPRWISGQFAYHWR